MKNNWQTISLGDVCKPLKGLTYKSDDYSNELEGQVFITLKCIAKGGGFNKEGIKYIKKSDKRTEILEPGDLIIANTDLTRAGDVIGAPLFVPQINGEDEYVYSMDISKLDLDHTKVDQKYLYQYLLTDSVRNYMRSISSGSTVLHLKVSLIDKLKLPLPNMVTQMKISDVLSSIDEAIQRTGQIIQKAENLKLGLINELLTKGVGNKKFIKTKLGEMPEDWDIKQLDEITLNITDGKHGDCQSESGSGYYFVSVKDIHDGQINYQGARQITKSDFDEAHRRTKLEIGDLLLTNSGTIGRMAVVQDNEYLNRTTFQKSVALIKPDPNKLDVYYLMFALSLVLKSLITESSGSAQKNLLLRDLRSYKIPLPPLNQQRKISEVIISIDSKIKYERLNYLHLVKQKKGLMHDIFNQKVQIN